jgi:competence protein ComEC
LVDARSGAPLDRGKIAVAPYLWEKKIHKLDYLVATHPQLDHVGGMAYIIRTFHVGAVLTNGMTSPLPFYQSFLDTIREKGVTPRAVSHVDTIEIDGCAIVFLNPVEGGMSDENNPNNASVVFRLSCPASSPASFLFTGDIENKAIDALLERSVKLKSDILKVPHHGSRGSLNERFMKEVAPQVAVFSVGKRNRYGHPHPTVLKAYKQQGTTVYQTDEDGAVMVTANPTGFIVESFRETRLQKIKWNRPLISQEIENVRNGLG